jgi:hypothetical protein
VQVPFEPPAAVRHKDPGGTGTYAVEVKRRSN